MALVVRVGFIFVTSESGFHDLVVLQVVSNDKDRRRASIPAHDLVSTHCNMVIKICLMMQQTQPPAKRGDSASHKVKESISHKFLQDGTATREPNYRFHCFFSCFSFIIRLVVTYLRIDQYIERGDVLTSGNRRQCTCIKQGWHIDWQLASLLSISFQRICKFFHHLTSLMTS